MKIKHFSFVFIVIIINNVEFLIFQSTDATDHTDPKKPFILKQPTKSTNNKS